MAKQTNPNQENHNAEPRDESQAEFISIPALRHVGPTLESEPGYFDRTRDAGSNGFSTPEEQIAREGTSPEPRHGGDATDLAATVTGAYDASSSGPGRNQQPEPLKTRLPGDTSSDPHTDLGPDNATTVRRRGER
jgi:hypothetical protein